MNRALLAALVAGSLLTGAVWAQEAPAAAKAEGEALVVTVKEVAGKAQRLDAGQKDPKWVPLKAGDKLSELTLIRTGLRSKVVLAMADRSTVVIDRATKMGVAEFRKKGKVAKTRLSLKYGSMRPTVHSARGPNDFAVSTPVATLAIPGSGGPLSFCGDIGFNVLCNIGKLQVLRGHRIRNLIKDEKTNNDMTRSVNILKSLNTPLLGDSFGGLTNVEKKYQQDNNGGRGGIGGGGSTKDPLPKLPTNTNGTDLDGNHIDPAYQTPPDFPDYPDHPDLPGHPDP